MRPATKHTLASGSCVPHTNVKTDDTEFTSGQKHNDASVFNLNAISKAHVKSHETKQSEDEANALRLAGIGYQIWDEIEDRPIFFSEEALAIFGFRSQREFRSQIRSRKDLEAHFHPDDRIKTSMALREAYANARDFAYDFRLIRQDRTLQYLRFRGELLRDENGRVVKSNGTYSDVTDLCSATERMRGDLRFLEATIDALPIGVSVKDKNLNTILVNKELRSRMKCEASLASRFGSAEVLDPYISRHMEEWDRTLLERGQKIPFFRYPIDLDDETRHLLTSKVPLTGTTNKVENIVTVTLDITDQVRTEQQLRSRDRQYRALADGSLQGVLIHRDFKPLYVNDAACQIFGYSRREILGVGSVLELFAPEAHDDLNQRLSRLMMSDSTLDTFETKGQAKDGQTLWLQNTGHVIEWRGEPAVQTIMIDISEQKRTQEQLRQSEKMEAMGKLTGGVAHDFNNLLAVVIGNLELIIENQAASETLRTNAQRAMEASERGAKLTQQLLSFSRAQALTPKPLRLNEVISDLLDICRLTLGEKITVDLRLADNLWLCQADKAQLENALLNLALNARDAMPDGGALTIEVYNQRFTDEKADNLTIMPGDYVKLTVTDTGIGMCRAVKDRIFDPFFTTKRTGKGTGLGLSMVYGLIKQLDGDIEVESEPGKGSSFHLLLPRHEEV